MGLGRILKKGHLYKLTFGLFGFLGENSSLR